MYTRPVYPRRKVVQRQQRTQTYLFVVQLECGHGTSYTVNARSIDTYKHPQTTGCYECYEATRKPVDKQPGSR